MRQADNGHSVSYPMNDLLNDVISILHDKPKELGIHEHHPGGGPPIEESARIAERTDLAGKGNIGELQQYLISMLEQSHGSASSNNRAQTAAAASVCANNESR